MAGETENETAGHRLGVILLGRSIPNGRNVPNALWEALMLSAIVLMPALPALLASPQLREWDLNWLFITIFLMCVLTHSRPAHIMKLGFAVFHALWADMACLLTQGVASLFFLAVTNLVAGYLAFQYWILFIKEREEVTDEWMTERNM